MKYEFLDYKISLVIIGVYSGLITIHRVSTEILFISFLVMLFIGWFLVWYQPVKNIIERQNLREEKQ